MLVIDGRLLPVLALHAQNLNQPDKDVQEVKLEANALVDRIPLDNTPLGKTRVVQDLLDIVESETTEDSKTTVQPDALRPHQGAGSGGGKDQRSKTGESDNGDTGKKGTTEIQILVLLGRGTNERDRTHHSDSVETSASEDSRVNKHQWGQKGSLGQVEGTPEGILQKVAIHLQLVLNLSETGNAVTYFSGGV